MTYTFKLARRLAVSRHFGMLPALLLFVACSGEDTTSPGSPPDPTSAVAVRITPRKVILATDQPIRFLARGLTSAGDSVGATVAWKTTGGTILPDGRFSAGAVGTFRVMGTNRTGDGVHVDTAIVIVVRRQPHLTQVEVRPGSVSLTPGDSLNFTAIGRTILDRIVPIGVKWTATGGTIDAGGTYVAGDSLGSYQVVAVNMGGTVTDTATVVIAPAPVTPLPPDTLPSDTLPPAPEPPAPPAPVLGQITLIPSSVTLAPSTTRQFKAYGRTTDGDSVAVSVGFAATGGTVTQGGLFTAGSTAGTYRLIASNGSLADTSVVIVSAPLGSGPATGIPFGPAGLWTTASAPSANSAAFTMSTNADSPEGIITRINAARAIGHKLILSMAGGKHDRYITDGKFDLAKWKARMELFNTPAIKTAIASGVASGTVLGANILDEPQHASWGGVITKAMLDGMAVYTKEIFPTIPVGLYVRLDWRATERFTRVDFAITQYVASYGSITAWRDKALAGARDNGVAVVFSINILNGGAGFGETSCPIPQTGGPGYSAGRCAMSPTQVREYAMALAPYGAALNMWQYDATFMAKAENQQVFREIAAKVATLPAKSWRRQ